MNTLDKASLREAHKLSWPPVLTWVGFAVVFLSLQGVSGALVIEGHPWLGILLIPLLGHLMHAHLIAFHETAHGNLCPSRVVNDTIGLFIGTLSFMSLSLYRAIHHHHHVHLGTGRDEELWPFVDPKTPRWGRRLAAFAELAFGLFFTPMLFLRPFLRRGSPITNVRVRRRIWAELGLIVLVWGSVASVATWLGAWLPLAVGYVIPALLAGNMQSWRKYIEHMGLTGSTALGCTRSVIPSGMMGRLLSWSLFHEPYHGVHHRYARLPHSRLPEFAAVLQPTHSDEPAPYTSYRKALGAMLSGLRDPRIGAQWLGDSDGTGERGT